MTTRDNIDRPDYGEEHIIEHLRAWGTESRVVFVDSISPTVKKREGQDWFCFAAGFDALTGWRVLFPMHMDQAEELRATLEVPESDSGRIPVVEVKGVNPKYLCWLDQQPREFDAVDRPPEPAQLTLFQGGQHDIR